MSLNSAQLLINFFNASLTDKDDYAFSPLWLALDDIEAHLPIWKLQGLPTDSFEAILPLWKRGVLGHVNQSGVIDSRADAFAPSRSDVAILVWLSKLLEEGGSASSQAQRDAIRTMVGAVRSELREDGSLPDRVRLHIARLLLHVEEVLDNFEIMGDAALQESVERLIGALRHAEFGSDDPGRWEKFWNTWVQPVAVALMGGSPGNILSVTQMLGGDQ